MIMAIPDEEYHRILFELKRRTRSNGIWLAQKNGKRILFRMIRDVLFAYPNDESQHIKQEVKPLSVIMKDKEDYDKMLLIQEIKKAHPDYDADRVNAEVDILLETRKSVEILMKEYKMTPKQAWDVLNAGLMEKSLNPQEDLPLLREVLEGKNAT